MRKCDWGIFVFIIATGVALAAGGLSVYSRQISTAVISFLFSGVALITLGYLIYLRRDFYRKKREKNIALANAPMSNHVWQDMYMNTPYIVDKPLCLIYGKEKCLQQQAMMMPPATIIMNVQKNKEIKDTDHPYTISFDKSGKNPDQYATMIMEIPSEKDSKQSKSEQKPESQPLVAKKVTNAISVLDISE